MNKKEKPRNKTIWNTEISGYYTKISNILLKDDRITDTSRGIMVRILSENQGKWNVVKSVYKNSSNNGRKIFDSSWSELLKYGYIIAKRRQGYWEYTINAEPNIWDKEFSQTAYVQYANMQTANMGP